MWEMYVVRSGLWGKCSQEWSMGEILHVCSQEWYFGELLLRVERCVLCRSFI